MLMKIARSVLNRRFRQAIVPFYQHLATLAGRQTLPLSSEKPNALIFLAPNYGNIGDLAIGYAQEEFLKSFKHFNVISVPITDTYKVLRFVRKNLKSDDIIFLVGGGNMGTMYSRAQRGREFLVNYLTTNPIISFPQSIVYSDSPGYEISANREKRSLSKAADHLILFAREKVSLDLMQQFFPGRIGFSPDIVFSLVSQFQNQPQKERSGVMLVLRKDAERNLSIEDHRLINSIASKFGPVSHRDHGIPDSEVDPTDLFKSAFVIFEEYREAGIVITDRLHGMIFAAITGTPCVVLLNKNHKISATYRDWVEVQCPYVTLLSELDEADLKDAMQRVITEEAIFGYADIRFDFSELKQVVEEKSS